jgi:N-acetylglucosamine kinase-like BadF-type ATPase
MPAAEPMPEPPPEPPCWGLGLDAGGTATRWALVDARGELRGEGALPPASGLQMATPDGQAGLADLWQHLAADVARATAAAGGTAPRLQVLAGLTGLAEGDAATVAGHLARALRLLPQQVRAETDVALAARLLLPAGGGILLVAGTGSIALSRGPDGTARRAGGRGYALDDGGSGYWIAREALRRVWRNEDEQPGAWRHSRLARSLFAQLGGADWSRTRQAVYEGTRGSLGQLARAVAEAAVPSGDEPADPQALALIDEAGAELARLARALHAQGAAGPVVLIGRVFDLHPRLEAAVREGLPSGVPVRRSAALVHRLAAARAAGRDGGPDGTPDLADT